MPLPPGLTIQKRPYWNKNCTKVLEKMVTLNKPWSEIQNQFKDYLQRTVKRKYNEATGNSKPSEIGTVVSQAPAQTSNLNGVVSEEYFNDLLSQDPNIQNTQVYDDDSQPQFSQPPVPNPAPIPQFYLSPQTQFKDESAIMNNEVEVKKETNDHVDSILGVDYFVSHDAGGLWIFGRKFEESMTLNFRRVNSKLVIVDVTYHLPEPLFQIAIKGTGLNEQALRYHLKRYEKKIVIRLEDPFEVVENSQVYKLSESFVAVHFDLIKNTDEETNTSF